MLQTVEAIYDPKQGLNFSEPVEINEPVKVLVTIITPCSSLTGAEKGSAAALVAALERHPSVESEYLSDEAIEAQVAEARAGWD